MKKLLPLVLLLIGAGAGVGAGIFLRPEPSTEIMDAAATEEEEESAVKASGNEDEKSEKKNGDTENNDSEFVRLSNQFVVPIVVGERVAGLVVLALSIEVSSGQTDTVFLREPKLRDSFLQILFDHANVGGFEGNFTNTEVLGRLRSALKEVAQRDLGRDIAKDVLIVEIARQDY